MLGALCILLVDKDCRAPYVEKEPNFATILTLCEIQEGYNDKYTAYHREVAAKTALSMVIRDPATRLGLVRSKTLKRILSLIQEPDFEVTPGLDNLFWNAAMQSVHVDLFWNAALQSVRVDVFWNAPLQSAHVDLSC